MTPPAEVADYVDQFRATIAQTLGLHFEDARLGMIEEVLRARSATIAGGASAYLATISNGRCSKSELRALAESLTISETSFFRHHEQFDAMLDAALPSLVAARGRDGIRILSVGCASGEEPYSLAMTIRETIPSFAGVSIRALDVNAANLRRANDSEFTEWSLRNTSDERRRRWFSARGPRFVLDRGIRDAVEFHERNIVDDDAAFWRENSYDIVFCRNVLMYFTPDAARAAIARIERALAPDGYLFLGHAETMRGLSNGFHLRHSHGAFYYQRRPESTPLDVQDSPPTALTWTPTIEPDVSWVDAVRHAADRVELLAHRHAELPAGNDWTPPSPNARAARRDADIADARALVLSERFADALARLDALPSELTDDVDVRLLRAVSLVHTGDLPTAERACHALLDADEFHAGAHYLLALCHEGRDDLSGARDRDEIALYLDPSFAMARLHLGLLARRNGNADAARRDLTAAMTALAHEDGSRLILYGGGFTRESLIALCRSVITSPHGGMHA